MLAERTDRGLDMFDNSVLLGVLTLGTTALVLIVVSLVMLSADRDA